VKQLYGLILAALLCAAVSPTAAAWTGLVGLANKHQLSQSQIGNLLIDELRCNACHASSKDTSTGPLADRPAPELSDVGSRIKPDYLRQFLLNPSSAHPGSAMPDVLSVVSVSERSNVADALTHYLVAQSNRKFQAGERIPGDHNVGKQLYHAVGCVACHAPREDKKRELSPTEQLLLDEQDEKEQVADEVGNTKTGVVDLNHIPAKYSKSSLSEFLFQPLRVRSAGRMPDMKLTVDESQAIANYLLGEQQASSDDPLQPQERLVELGKKYFVELNCAACHKLADSIAKPSVVALRDADRSRGCIATPLDNSPTSTTPSKSNSPRYALTADEVAAIRAAIDAPQQPDSDTQRIAKTLTAFNCIACHVRDEFGGVADDRNAYFETSEKNLGDEGRIPPPLTLLGAKLRPEWLKKVLFDGEGVRPYMSTRMPQFGEPNLRHLPELVQRVDKLESTVLDIPSPESDTKEKSKEAREREKALRTAGRELLGQQGVYCIACHNFNGKPAPVNKGIDLMTTFERLQPGWFNNFVRNPGKYRPRIIMPYSWPDGVAVHEKILDGDTQMQIEAIWYYLSLGTSAADPPGIRRVDTILSVGDTARTYRGRSSVAGFRGIAVGFPEGVNYAFNAETGTLSAIWQGDFIRVDRGGQGSGGFTPSAPAIQLAQDVSFAQLSDVHAPWPLRPAMTKEAPVNPDPLYPKNLGYQFKGYYLDESQVPTFMYRFGDVEIEDRSVAEREGNSLQLVRTLQFTSPAQKLLWFRALTGETANLKVEKTSFLTDKLRLQIPKVPPELRPTTGAANLPAVPSFELLLPIDIPEGKSTVTLNYELLKRQ
jgi:mono/diheme cytochrome c family protein